MGEAALYSIALKLGWEAVVLGCNGIRMGSFGFKLGSNGIRLGSKLGSEFAGFFLFSIACDLFGSWKIDPLCNGRPQAQVRSQNRGPARNYRSDIQFAKSLEDRDAPPWTEFPTPEFQFFVKSLKMLIKIVVTGFTGFHEALIARVWPVKCISSRRGKSQ